MPRGVYERRNTPVVQTSDGDGPTLAAQEKVGGTAHRTVPTAYRDDATHGPEAGMLTYVALKPMKVAGQKVNPGDLVADAKNWRNVHNYLSAGYLAVVSDNSGGRF